MVGNKKYQVEVVVTTMGFKVLQLSDFLGISGVTLRAIPSGVLNCLAKLTSRNPSIHAEAVDNIYPAHANALRKASLAPPVFSTMGDLCRKQDEKVEIEKERDVSEKKKINVYFCVAYSRYFSTSICRVIYSLKKSFNFTWLRV